MENNYNFTFAIDCDEVLRKTLDTMVELYNKHFNANKKKDEVKDFKVENSFPDIETATGMTASHWFFQEHGKEIFLETEPFPHIKEDIETLRKYGRVVIITYQKSYQNKIDTLLWLEKQGIEVDGVCFLKDKTLLNSDFLVDDNDWNFQGSNAQHGILIDAPYNADKNLNGIINRSNLRSLERCHTLHDFVEKFTKAVSDLEKMKAVHPVETNKVYRLKKQVPYKDHTVYGIERSFGQPGNEVMIKHYYLFGTQPTARIELVHAWGDVCVDVNDLEKYI